MFYRTVAVTGHRPYKLPWGQDEESPSCALFQSSLLIRIMMLLDRGYDTFYTGMSWGVDLIFGELVASLKEKHPNIKLIGVLPFEDMHIKWHVSYQERFFNLVEACDDIVVLNSRFHKDCYKQRNEYLVAHADHLIAVFDERYRRSGTLQTINLAKKKGIAITFIDPYTMINQTIKGKPELRLLK